jgi:hypothetical protein
MKTDKWLELKRLVESGISEKPEATADEIAAYVHEKNPELIDTFRDIWAREKLVSLVKAWRRKKPKDAPEQLLFGFKDTSVRIPLKQGFVSVEGATITQIRESINVVATKGRKRIEPIRDRLRQMADAMQPWALAHKNITYGEFIARVRAGEPTPVPKFTLEERSRIFREAWEKRTPGQRRAIVRKRLATRAANADGK